MSFSLLLLCSSRESIFANQLVLVNSCSLYWRCLRKSTSTALQVLLGRPWLTVQLSETRAVPPCKCFVSAATLPGGLDIMILLCNFLWRGRRHMLPKISQIPNKKNRRVDCYPKAKFYVHIILEYWSMVSAPK